MSKKNYKIKTEDGWSKRYPVDRLKEKLAAGVIEDDWICSADGGATEVTVAEVLADAATPAAPRSRRSKLKPIRRKQSIDQEPDPAVNSAARDSGQDTGEHPEATDSTVEPEPPAGQAQEPASSDAVLSAEPDQIAPKPISDVLPGKADSSQAPLVEDGATGDADDSQIDIFSMQPDSGTEFVDEDVEPAAETSQAAETYSIPAPAAPSPPVSAGVRPAGKLPPVRLPEPPSSPVDPSPPEPGAPSQPVGNQSIQRAAAMALLAEERARQAEKHAQSKALPGTEKPADTEIPEEQVKPKQGFSVLQRTLSIITIVFGVSATTFLIWFFSGSAADNAAALRSFESGFSDDDSLEALKARTEILRVKFNRLAKAITDGDLSDLDLPAEAVLEKPPVPLVPYIARDFTDKQQAQYDDLLRRVSRMVQEQDPDGRKLGADSAKLYSGYVVQIMGLVASRGPDRVDALREISELSKLLYLLQLLNTRADDDDMQQSGRTVILSATNEALQTIYVELLTGDMRFTDLFSQATSEEKAELLLVRYWYYRAANPVAANEWLQSMLPLVDEDQHTRVRDSIAEVDGIE